MIGIAGEDMIMPCHWKMEYRFRLARLRGVKSQCDQSTPSVCKSDGIFFTNVSHHSGRHFSAHVSSHVSVVYHCNDHDISRAAPNTDQLIE